MIFLFETYNTQKSLENLSNIIIEQIALKTFDNHEIEFFQSVTLKHVSKFINDTTINDFLQKYGNTEILILSDNDINIPLSKGNYIVDGNRRMIILKETKYSIEKYNEFLIDKKNDKNLLTYYLPLSLYDYKNTLLHELQHAFDDYRSKGKFTDNKNKSFTNNEIELLNNIDNIKEEEYAFLQKSYKNYLNLRHEIDARFTQSIEKISFYDLDLDESFKQNKNIYTMKSFEDIKKKFKNIFSGFNFLSDKERLRILSKLGKFYILETEFVKNYNLKSDI